MLHAFPHDDGIVGQHDVGFKSKSTQGGQENTNKIYLSSFFMTFFAKNYCLEKKNSKYFSFEI